MKSQPKGHLLFASLGLSKYLTKVAPVFRGEERPDPVFSNERLSGLDPGALPEGETPGAQSFADVCSRCHALPDPNAHSPREWQAVVERMAMNMENVGFGPLAPEQRTAILDYLKGQSRK
ncbi:c-type cytochrome [Desulfuromonas sp. DDH964]|uniref:c-type cytochrome n=1 Tax=Desulfuromonas sp. DDH964 TaxID=1823759 RepID=UPI000AD15D58|nr:cytochrome c [Desulfuromonas sp. DDH964]